MVPPALMSSLGRPDRPAGMWLQKISRLRGMCWLALVLVNAKLTHAQSTFVVPSTSFTSIPVQTAVPVYNTSVGTLPLASRSQKKKTKKNQLFPALSLLIYCSGSFPQPRRTCPRRPFQSTPLR
jgi:hypothetical protein